MSNILILRTDKPEAELYLYRDGVQIAQDFWVAHRQLAETIHRKILQLLEQNDVSLQNITGIICYHGPGSFTGLRIGLSVANALAYSLRIPIVGTNGQDWITDGLKLIAASVPGVYVMPEYGEPAHITEPKH